MPGLVAALPQTPGVGAAAKAYATLACRQAITDRGGTPDSRHKGRARSDALGQARWVVERTNAWLSQFRHLEMRRERRADLHLAVLVLACALICCRTLPRLCNRLSRGKGPEDRRCA